MELELVEDKVVINSCYNSVISCRNEDSNSSVFLIINMFVYMHIYIRTPAIFFLSLIPLSCNVRGIYNKFHITVYTLKHIKEESEHYLNTLHSFLGKGLVYFEIYARHLFHVL